MKKIIKGLIGTLGLVCLAFFALNVLGVYDITNHIANVLPQFVTSMSVPSITAAFAGAAYYDKTGALRSDGNNSLVAGAGAYGGNCAPKGNYTFPDQFTLTVTTVGAANVKFTQADNMTEAIQGSIGTVWFAVQQLPIPGAPIVKQDGTNINAAESLARALQTYGLKINKIIATGTAIAGVTSLLINMWRANLTGANNEDITLNMNPALPNPTVSIEWVGSFDLTSNVSFRVAVPAATTLNLTFYVGGVIPYA